ncbi:MAG: DciA family protein [Pseudomonadota bacterium]
MMAASACAKKAMRGAAARRGIAEARLITHWPEIAGERLASACRPVRVKQSRGIALGGVLVLAVDGARASEVEHAAPIVIERVNAHYGYGAISEVKLTQAVGAPISSEPAARPRPRAASPEDLPPEKRQKLEAWTKPVADDALRAALTQLGANIMAKAPDPSPEDAERDAKRGVVRSLSQRASPSPDAGPKGAAGRSSASRRRGRT